MYFTEIGMRLAYSVKCRLPEKILSIFYFEVPDHCEFLQGHLRSFKQTLHLRANHVLIL